MTNTLKTFTLCPLNPINKVRNKAKSKKKEKERHISELEFKNTSDSLKEEYLGRDKGVKLEILSTTRFVENSDLSMSYLGKTKIVKKGKITAEENFDIRTRYTTGKLLDSTKYQILLDTIASKSFMSKSHYLCCKSLHSLP